MKKPFKQKLGTAIGTEFAPPYAILYMANLKKNWRKLLKKNNDLVEVHR